jgi:ATP-dependent DNA helicase RecQ
MLLSQKKNEELAEKLQKLGVSAKAYHAGLDNAIRSKTQDDLSTMIVKWFVQP